MQVEGVRCVYSPEGLVEADVIKVKGALRCAYCHGDAQGLLECCDACGVLVHAECRRELGRCSTLGCAAPSVQRIDLSARLAEPGILITQACLRRWASRLLALILLVVCPTACLASAVTFSSRCRPHSWQMSQALSIRVASANFHADHRRYPASLEELTRTPPGGEPYLVGHHEIERFHLVTRGQVVWIAIEIESEENPYERDTIRLLRELYEPPEADWAPLTSSVLTPPRLR